MLPAPKPLPTLPDEIILHIIDLSLKSATIQTKRIIDTYNNTKDLDPPPCSKRSIYCRTATILAAVSTGLQKHVKERTQKYSQIADQRLASTDSKLMTHYDACSEKRQSPTKRARPRPECVSGVCGNCVPAGIQRRKDEQIAMQAYFVDVQVGNMGGEQSETLFEVEI